MQNNNLNVEDLSSAVNVTLAGLTVKLKRYAKHIYILDFNYNGTAAITNGISCGILTNLEYSPAIVTYAALSGYNTTLIYNTPVVGITEAGQITISGCTVASGTGSIIIGQLVWIK